MRQLANLCYFHMKTQVSCKNLWKPMADTNDTWGYGMNWHTFFVRGRDMSNSFVFAMLIIENSSNILWVGYKKQTIKQTNMWGVWVVKHWDSNPFFTTTDSVTLYCTILLIVKLMLASSQDEHPSHVMFMFWNNTWKYLWRKWKETW